MPYPCWTCGYHLLDLRHLSPIPSPLMCTRPDDASSWGVCGVPPVVRWRDEAQRPRVIAMAQARVRRVCCMGAPGLCFPCLPLSYVRRNFVRRSGAPLQCLQLCPTNSPQIARRAEFDVFRLDQNRFSRTAGECNRESPSLSVP